jgi:hypothetical protein
MALTFRDNNGAPLSYDEMDSNWRFFTGSFTNTGTITAEGFTSNGNISASGYIGSDGPYYIQGIQFANYHLPSETIRLGWTGDNTLLYGTTITLNADVTASGNISSSADVYGVTGSFLHLEGDGSQLTGIATSDPLSTIVSNGNTLSNGQTIEALNGGGQLNLRAGADGRVSLDTEGGSYGSSFLYIQSGSGGQSVLQFNSDSFFDAQGTEVRIYSPDYIEVSGSTLKPFIDSAMDIGTTSRKYKTIYGITGSFSHLLGASPLTIQSDNFNIDSSGNITSSANISASGDMYSSMFRGEQLFLNSGSSQYLNTPAAGDAALIAMSGSGAFSTTSAIAPNNLVLFSEYKTGDTGTVNGKAASSILLTVNHGASNGNNAVAQIACVAQGISSNYGDLVFSTRGLSNNVTERMRITQDVTVSKVLITGSLEVSGALSKGSGTFKIAHPISTGSLYHSFIEGPKCDLIYRGTTTLTNGVADINIDSVSNMTEGTFVALTQDPQLFLQNTNGWEPLKGSISGNILSIECKSTSSVDNVSWMVVAERADDFIKNWNLTDENGHLIPEQ